MNYGGVRLAIESLLGSAGFRTCFGSLPWRISGRRKTGMGLATAAQQIYVTLACDSNLCLLTNRPSRGGRGAEQASSGWSLRRSLSHEKCGLTLAKVRAACKASISPLVPQRRENVRTLDGRPDLAPPRSSLLMIGRRHP